MFCRKCGAEMPDLALVCGKCGTPVKPYQDSVSRCAEERGRAFGKPEEPAAEYTAGPETGGRAEKAPEPETGGETAAAPEIGGSEEIAVAPEAGESEETAAAPEAGESEETAAAPEAGENTENNSEPETGESTETNSAPETGEDTESSASGDEAAENSYSREIQRIREEYRTRQQGESPEVTGDEPRVSRGGDHRVPLAEDNFRTSRRGVNPRGAYRAADGRIPYGAAPSFDPETERAVQSKYSSLALTLGIAAVVALLFPYLAIPLSVMAVLFGGIGLRQGEYAKRRAIVGIVLGAIALGTAAVLLISMAMMAPYTEDLIRIFEEYMRSMR